MSFGVGAWCAVDIARVRCRSFGRGRFRVRNADRAIIDRGSAAAKFGDPAIDRSPPLALYRVAHAAGDARVDPPSPDRNEVEALARARGFRGALFLGADDDEASIVVYRFEHEADVGAFRATTAALACLGPLGATGETLFAVHPLKTFGASA